MSGQIDNVMQKQQKQITGELGAEKKEENITQLVGFIVGDEEYAIPILNIQEIIKPIDYTRVPSTPNYVLGVFNLRGNVIPLIDLRMKFNLPSQNQDKNTRYIVMKDGENVAGFVIDKLTEAIRLKESQIEQAPETLHRDKGMINAIGKRANSIITILNVDKLLKRDF
jgi:purine-binding chemotaxis protein CheW